MSTQRVLLLSYLVIGLLLGLVLSEFFSSAVASVAFLAPLGHDVLGLTGWTWSDTLAFALTIGFGLYAWRAANLRQPATEVVEELQRVTWPTAGETRAATWAVIIASGVVALLLGVFDYGWALVTEQVYAPN